ncbi:MAG: PfkB family carbohydrate kinase, partial [Planctomycetota bacterium]
MDESRWTDRPGQAAASRAGETVRTCPCDKYKGDKAQAFWHVDEKMARALVEYCPLAALKVGARGSYVVSREGEFAAIAPVPAAQVVDTTAAGDFWAAGFLSGWLRGRDLATCGHYGSVV